MPDEVVGQNDFGNLIVRDIGGLYWRICPEELDCKVIANSRAQLDVLSSDQEFLQDWYMSRLAGIAKAIFGELPNDRKYCLKLPGVLGGPYDESNIGTISLTELIRASGTLAVQVKDLPDASRFQLKVID